MIHLEGQNVGKRIMIPEKIFPGFMKNESYRIRFLNVDNTVALLVNDGVIVKWDYPKNTYMYSHEPNNVPLIGVLAADVLFQRIEIERDIYYTSDIGKFAVNAPYTVPEGQYFLLGDNSAESEDCRVFGAIPEKDLVGKPFLVYYPFSRFRFL